MDTLLGAGQAMMDDMPWHRQGLFMGMHWAWWTFWIVCIALLLWAFWRMHEDTRETHRWAQERLDAEERLRGRFADGELTEQEFVQKMQVLQHSRMNPV